MRTYKNNPGLYITATLVVLAGLFMLFKETKTFSGSITLKGHVVRSYFKKVDVSDGSRRYHRPIKVDVEYKVVRYKTPQGKYRTISIRAKDIKDDYSVDVLYNPSSKGSRAKGSKSLNMILAVSCFIFGAFLWFLILTEDDDTQINQEKSEEEKYLKYKEAQEEIKKKKREKYLSALNDKKPENINRTESKNINKAPAVKKPKKKKVGKRKKKK